jgi:LacI family transcriptional regulator
VTTMHDVARLAGVSAKTVSRVFNDDPHVRPETRDRVQAAIRELNYVPNMLARTFRDGKDAILGMAVPDLADPFFAAMIGSIEHVADSYGVAVMITGLNRDPGRERDSLQAMLRRQVMGLIVCPIGNDQSYLKPWQARTPIVFVDRPPSGLVADTIVQADLEGGRAATAHLVAHGHRRIGFVGDSPLQSTTGLRLEGYHQALSQAGLAVDPALTLLDLPTHEETERAVEALMRSDRRPTALFSSNTRCTVGILRAFQTLGLTDVALVSFGDFSLSTVITPALTVIDQDPERLGRVAADRLFLRRDHPTRRLPRTVMLPVELIARGSGEIRRPHA